MLRSDKLANSMLIRNKVLKQKVGIESLQSREIKRNEETEKSSHFKHVSKEIEIACSPHHGMS